MAAFILAVAVGGASARRLQFSNQSFRIVWSFLQFAGGEAFRIECPVTIEGSFHSRTISKVSGQLIGYVSRAEMGAFANCQNKTNIEAISFQQTALPWHIRFDHFDGTLPNIEEFVVQFINMGILITSLSQHCLYKSTAARPVKGRVVREVNGVLTQVIPDPTLFIPKVEGLLCPEEILISQVVGTTTTITVQNTTTKISVTLVQ